MDARSIAATRLPDGSGRHRRRFHKKPKYFFDSAIYANRVFDSKGVADPGVEIKFGPNIKDWPAMCALTDNLVLKVVSEIHDPVTTTDELIPSERLLLTVPNSRIAEFTLSRKDPAYVGRAKEVQAEKAREEGPQHGGKRCQSLNRCLK